MRSLAAVLLYLGAAILLKILSEGLETKMDEAEG